MIEPTIEVYCKAFGNCYKSNLEVAAKKTVRVLVVF